MKKLSDIIFLLSFLAFSCSKDSLLQNDPGIDQETAKVLAKCGPVITVSPNGHDDTQALIDAFVKAGKLNANIKLTVNDYGVNNKFISKQNPRYSSGPFPKNLRDKLEKEHKMLSERHSHGW